MARTLIEIFCDDLPVVLTDLVRAQWVIKEVFDKHKIDTILEVGVCKIPALAMSSSKRFNYGQSTKILMMLAQLHGVSKYLSIDTDDCTDTVKTCGEWLKEIGWAVPRAHSYQTKESLALDIKAEFPQGVDLVFLDSNHDWYVNEPQYRGGAGYTYREICHIAPYLTADGCILLHDTFNHYAQEARGNNVDGAICRFVDENHEWEYIEHRPNGNGLGELRRK